MRLIDIDDPRNCYVGSHGDYERYNIDPDVLEEALLSVKPKRKKGKWIYITDGHYEYFKCDQCEKHSGEPTPFCRYCGADMREKGENSESN